MRISNDLTGILPSLNDAVAVVVICFAYLNRLYALAQPEASISTWGAFMTDFLMPGLAAAWLFVMAMYTAYVRLGEP